MTPSRNTQTLAPRGLTLLELMVGTVTTTIILAAVAVSFAGIQGSYQTESRIKVSVEGVRTATQFVEQRLRLAGYGVDPRFAFDFSAVGLPGETKSNHTLVFASGAPKSVTDDLAFRYRDAAYLRRGRFLGAAGLQLEPGFSFGVDLAKGQRLLVSCNNGKKYLVLKVNAGGVAKNLGASANFTVDTKLSSTTQDDTCLSKTGELDAPYVLLLHEVRLRIMDLGGRPFLMAFQGLDELNMDTAVPLAADVESFQVAYIMNRPPLDGDNAGLPPVDIASDEPNWILGDLNSADKDRHPPQRDPLKPEPKYGDPYDAAIRYSNHPANIRAVRVAISVRSATPEPNGRRGFGREDLEDSGELSAPDGYYRTNMTTTVRVPNLMSRSGFNPPVGALHPSGSNVWGG
ncbi:type IV pilus assembly protein PilW [Archangium gephyra]|uniref:Type IV pilus assembly protein PilW n=2 Tax=Archangium gephyra TaxID=48 RepID=A0ABX9K6L3_9BACT|nr:PilW family protein [Archangium gephyra]REG34524.1 type IV pilus assembly protein PilW [Archangium gephyra]